MGLPFTFNLSLFFRLLLPGIVVTGALFPAIHLLCSSLAIHIQNEYIVGICTVIIGWLFIVCNMHIYMALEGRRYWPSLVSNYFMNKENKRLLKVIENFKKAKDCGDSKGMKEIGMQLRQFPIDTNSGEYKALYPTRIGNLICSYEQYPSTRYGINSIFYWYRLWLLLNENIRNHLDNYQSIADSAAYIITALFFDSLIMFIYAALTQLHFNPLIKYHQYSLILLMLGFILLFFSYVFYRASLQLHASYGEHFKSMFDIYGGLIPIDEIIGRVDILKDDVETNCCSKSVKYRTIWRYLQNYEVKTSQGVVPVIPNDQLSNKNIGNKEPRRKQRSILKKTLQYLYASRGGEYDP